jgi:hypothetical protein
MKKTIINNNMCLMGQCIFIKTTFMVSDHNILGAFQKKGHFLSPERAAHIRT